MNLKDLLLDKNIDPQHVLVLRHRPLELELNKVLPWLAAEKPDVFNAYQQTQIKQVEQGMTHAAYVAAFIGHEPGKALFVGLYSVKGWKPITPKEYWQIPANVELEEYGHKGFTEEESRSSILWFDLVLTDFYADWKGKLIVHWPPQDRNWYRWAHKPKNEMPIFAIREESAFDTVMPEWNEIVLKWDELRILPTRWKSKLAEWRGIYYIFDTSDGKGYVGSAYGEWNLLGRWLNYAMHGDGGNNLLKKRDPHKFEFSILQRVSPDLKPADVIQLENTWKERLHTREYGLNDN
jgi:hypothetical protein